MFPNELGVVEEGNNRTQSEQSRSKVVPEDYLHCLLYPRI